MAATAFFVQALLCTQSLVAATCSVPRDETSLLQVTKTVARGTERSQTDLESSRQPVQGYPNANQPYWPYSAYASWAPVEAEESNRAWQNLAQPEPEAVAAAADWGADGTKAEEIVVEGPSKGVDANAASVDADATALNADATAVNADDASPEPPVEMPVVEAPISEEAAKPLPKVEPFPQGPFDQSHLSSSAIESAVKKADDAKVFKESPMNPNVVASEDSKVEPRLSGPTEEKIENSKSDNSKIEPELDENTASKDKSQIVEKNSGKRKSQKMERSSSSNAVEDLTLQQRLVAAEANTVEAKAAAKASEFDKILAEEKRKVREMHLKKHQDELQNEVQVAAEQKKKAAEQKKAAEKKAKEEAEKAKKAKAAADKKKALKAKRDRESWLLKRGKTASEKRLAKQKDSEKKRKAAELEALNTERKEPGLEAMVPYDIFAEDACEDDHLCTCDAGRRELEVVTERIGLNACKRRCLDNADCKMVYCEEETANFARCTCHEFARCDETRIALNAGIHFKKDAELVDLGADAQKFLAEGMGFEQQIAAKEHEQAENELKTKAKETVKKMEEEKEQNDVKDYRDASKSLKAMPKEARKEIFKEIFSDVDLGAAGVADWEHSDDNDDDDDD